MPFFRGWLTTPRTIPIIIGDLVIIFISPHPILQIRRMSASVVSDQCSVLFSIPSYPSSLQSVHLNTSTTHRIQNAKYIAPTIDLVILLHPPFVLSYARSTIHGNRRVEIQCIWGRLPIYRCLVLGLVMMSRLYHMHT